MARYKNFGEYLEINYFSVICERLKKACIERRLLDDNVINETIDITKLLIFKIEFIEQQIDYVKFKFYLNPEITYSTNDSTSYYTDSYRFYGAMEGSFKTGFEMIDVNKDNSKGKFTEQYTQNIVPIMKKEDYDNYATKFLEYFYPEALKTPMKINLKDMLANKGMKFYQASLEDNILGKIYFDKDRAVVLDSIRGYGYPRAKLIDVEPGTIIINYNATMIRCNGSMRNTIVHEAVHWFFHSNYFELKLLLDDKLKCAVCYSGTINSNDVEVEWLERQARALAPRILMPKDTTLIKTKELIEEADQKLLDREFKKNSDKWEFVVDRVSKFFGVSKLSAKIRLYELGFRNVDGVFNYTANGYIKNFSFKDNFLDEKHTFVLTNEAYLNLVQTNEIVKNAIAEGKLIYSNSLLVVNNPLYFDYIKDEITSYGLEHVDECCIVFKILNDRNKDTTNGFSFVLYSSSNGGVTYAQIDEVVIIELIKKAKTDEQHYRNHRGSIPSSFAGTLKYLMEHCDYTQEALSFDSDVSVRTISSYVSEDNHAYKIETILKLAFAMRLSTPYIRDLLDKAGISLKNEKPIFSAIIENSKRKGLIEKYVEIEMTGENNLLGLSSEFLKGIEEYIKDYREQLEKNQKIMQNFC